MTDANEPLSKLVPGFDFFQGLVKTAGAGLPGVGQWMTPSMDPEEIDKRIQELKTVQYWLEQNARLIATTIQGLEVQRLTLTTLQAMNVSMAELSESLKIKPAAAAPTPAPAPAQAPAQPPVRPEAPADTQGAGASPSAAPQVPPGVADPMQWWGALTQQFTEIAATAMKDGAADAARNLNQAVATAAEAQAKVQAAMPAGAAVGTPAARAATKPAAKPKAKRAAAKKAAPGKPKPPAP